MSDAAVQRLIDEAMRLQAEDGFPGPTPVGSAWFRLHGLPPVRWVTTERVWDAARMMHFGGDAALVMDGHWHQAATLRGSRLPAVLLAEHVQDRPALSALAGLILAGGYVRLVEQSAEYVQRLIEHHRAYQNPPPPGSPVSKIV